MICKTRWPEVAIEVQIGRTAANPAINLSFDRFHALATTGLSEWVIVPFRLLARQQLCFDMEFRKQIDNRQVRGAKSAFFQFFRVVECSFDPAIKPILD